jgi:S-formylglutathione hydrolase
VNNGWSTQDISGKPAEVFDPPGPTRPRFAMIFLHGHGRETLHDRPAFSLVMEQLQMACVCPHGERCWWTDRICPEFDHAISPECYVLERIVPFLRTRWDLAPPAIGLIGISMGGQGALRLAFKHAGLFPAVAGISSAIDYHELYGQGTALDAMYDSKEQCRQDTALLHIPPVGYPPHIFFCIDPDDAQWHRGNDRLHEKLNALGIPHAADLATRAGGHGWDYFNHMADRAVRFVYRGLEQESRRLL